MTDVSDGLLLTKMPPPAETFPFVAIICFMGTANSVGVVAYSINETDNLACDENDREFDRVEFDLKT